MVQVSDIQAQTISAAAAAHLRTNAPLVVPDAVLTEEYAAAVNDLLAARIRPFLDGLRAQLDLAVREETIGGTRIVVIEPRKVRRNRKGVAGVFAHGGGFALLSGHDYNAYRMAHDLGIVVYSVDYSLSPKARFPVAFEETQRAYQAVTRRHRTVVVAGSSAGANLLIGTVRAAARGRRPAAAGFFAPAADLRGIGDSYVSNDGRDPLLTRDTAEKLWAAYRGTASAVDPQVSPLLADFSGGFVPTTITTGTRDLLQSDAVRFTRVLRQAGVPVRLRVWEGMWHAFESVPGLPEGDECMAEVFGFLDRHL
ncbi:alpha/beta hydrolase [Pseudonocardia yuanmonensis]|uniref:Alpha/beta hydrolase n=1 Tax=Pseudonocardia yuanmonensis TaxID=1095914 RepID=A0ABP8VY60_9PSEU